jgi:hypothetical protein
MVKKGSGKSGHQGEAGQGGTDSKGHMLTKDGDVDQRTVDGGNNPGGRPKGSTNKDSTSSSKGGKGSDEVTITIEK